MTIRDGFTDAIGNTLRIRLRKASEETGCTILGKAEFLNPGGSVKDARRALHDPGCRGAGDLQPGGVVLEGTAGWSCAACPLTPWAPTCITGSRTLRCAPRGVPEGLCLGGSSGINVAGTIRLARELGLGCTVVTVLCDWGHRNQSKRWNPVFLAQKDLPAPD